MLDAMMKALEERASNGDGRAQYTLAKNWEQAFEAAKNWFTGANFFRLNSYAGAQVGRDSCQILGMAIQPVEDERVDIWGFQKTYHTAGSISKTSLTMRLSYDDALAMADAINETLHEYRRLRDYEQLRRDTMPESESEG